MAYRGIQGYTVVIKGIQVKGIQGYATGNKGIQGKQGYTGVFKSNQGYIGEFKGIH